MLILAHNGHMSVLFDEQVLFIEALCSDGASIDEINKYLEEWGCETIPREEEPCSGSSISPSTCWPEDSSASWYSSRSGEVWLG